MAAAEHLSLLPFLSASFPSPPAERCCPRRPSRGWNSDPGRVGYSHTRRRPAPGGRSLPAGRGFPAPSRPLGFGCLSSWRGRARGLRGPCPPAAPHPPLCSRPEPKPPLNLPVLLPRKLSIKHTNKDTWLLFPIIKLISRKQKYSMWKLKITIPPRTEIMVYCNIYGYHDYFLYLFSFINSIILRASAHCHSTY